MYLPVNDEHGYLGAVLACVEDLLCLKEGSIEPFDLDLSKHLSGWIENGWEGGRGGGEGGEGGGGGRGQGRGGRGDRSRREIQK